MSLRSFGLQRLTPQQLRHLAGGVARVESAAVETRQARIDLGEGARIEGALAIHGAVADTEIARVGLDPIKAHTLERGAVDEQLLEAGSGDVDVNEARVDDLDVRSRRRPRGAA